MAFGIVLCGMLAALVGTLAMAVLVTTSVWWLLPAFFLSGIAGMAGAIFLMDRWMRAESAKEARP